MMVFIHFQLLRSSYQSAFPYGDTAFSASSSYTGTTTTANLPELALVTRHCRRLAITRHGQNELLMADEIDKEAGKELTQSVRTQVLDDTIANPHRI